MASTPSMDLERILFAEGHRYVAGMDEVGTGAPAGPCYCALVVVSVDVGDAPEGVNDSKALTPAKREALTDPITTWALDWALGTASAAEIDEYGLTIALRLAGHRALAALTTLPDVIILDGTRDWLSVPPAGDMLAPVYGDVHVPRVVTQVKADRTSASVAAASVMAKVARDAHMVAIADGFPAYGWADNKGYGTADHIAAIRNFGYTPHHRRSWQLRGLAE